ncbi:MAG: epoxyqueuosine reductase, partial [Theionarchaea archaeon]|nr:epoxyqueuosine reductase [Theionarchaea archaeon]
MVKKEIESAILEFINSPMNTLKNADNEPAWGTPLVGYSSGADPLYEFYKREIGEFHTKPVEFFAGQEVEPSDLTVVSWVLPQTEVTKADHRAETHFPSERWARSRTFGEEVNDDLRRHVVGALANMGIKSVAPAISPEFKTVRDSRHVFASSWSERHAAYASGLGTFGLSDGLITPVGKAIRVGS